MARRLAFAVAWGLLNATGLQAQQPCPAAVPFDSVRASLLQSLRAVGLDDTASARFAQVELWLDSLQQKLPAGFVYTRENMSRGSWGVAAKRGQSVETMRDAMPGMDGLMQRALNTANQSAILRALDSTGNRPLLKARDDMYCIARDVRISEGLEKLRRFERKFGPTSVKLNGLEVVLNYATQLLPGQRLFGVDDQGWPRPFELVAAYRTTYATLVDATGPDKKYTPQAVSVAEFGLRHYNFGKTWGAEDGSWLSRALKPATWSLGVVIAPQANGALRYPWRGESRIGPYLAWGGLKVGYLTGKDRRVIVSREVLVIPYLF